MTTEDVWNRLSGMSLVRTGGDDNAFPSQHAGERFAAATSLDAQVGGAIGPIAVRLATAVALTRVFGRKHRMPDVIAGLAVGITAGSLAAQLP